jgi:DNA-binding transcriptional LysR family regulator
MVDRFEAMSILLLAVEKGSFTAAAKALGMPLPTVSRKIGELEAHLGVRLLTRTTRRLSLTDAGAAYLGAARRILEDVEEAERTAAGEFSAPRGELIVTAPVLFGRLHLLPVVADFLGAYPEINVRMILSDRNLQLADEHVDLAVRIGPLPDSSLVATPVGAIRQVVCASPAFLAEHGQPERPEDLAALPCVTFDFLSPSIAWRFRGGGRAGVIEAPVRPRLSVSTAEAAVWAAEQGVGVTRVVHYQCADALKRGTLRILLADFEPEPLPVNLLHAPRSTMPLKMRTFLDFAAPRLRADVQALARGA